MPLKNSYLDPRDGFKTHGTIRAGRFQAVAVLRLIRLAAKRSTAVDKQKEKACRNLRQAFQLYRSFLELNTPG